MSNLRETKELSQITRLIRKPINLCRILCDFLGGKCRCSSIIITKKARLVKKNAGTRMITNRGMILDREVIANRGMIAYGIARSENIKARSIYSIENV